MTQTLGLNENNDLYLGADGNIVVLSGIEAVAGACETISRTKLGEMVLSDTQGIPYDQAIFNGSPNLKVWEAYLLSALQNVQGVIQVSNLKITVQENTLIYQAMIDTQFGTTQIGS